MLPTTPAIFVFLFLASVFGAPASELQKELKTFTLQAINSKLPLGYSGQPKGETLQWKPLYTHESTRSAGGPIGWGFEPSDKAVILNLFVQFNAKEGVVFDSTDTARTIIIRKSGQVVLGNLGLEQDAQEAPWTISNNIFGFGGNYGKFKYCKRDGEKSFSLYYHPYPNTGCKSITIAVKYDK